MPCSNQFVRHAGAQLPAYVVLGASSLHPALPPDHCFHTYYDVFIASLTLEVALDEHPDRLHWLKLLTTLRATMVVGEMHRTPRTGGGFFQEDEYRCSACRIAREDEHAIRRGIIAFEEVPVPNRQNARLELSCESDDEIPIAFLAVTARGTMRESEYRPRGT